eukprot:5504613-Prymnesium_polylepis.1
MEHLVVNRRRGRRVKPKSNTHRLVIRRTNSHKPRRKERLHQCSSGDATSRSILHSSWFSTSFAIA